MQRPISLIVLTLFLLNSLLLHSQTYSWGNLPFGGGGFVSAVIVHPTTANVIYARTDVGGLYRWENTTKTWTPLTDWVSTSEMGYLGVESVALDPQNPAKVYALVGLDYFNSGKTAILISNDYGATFTSVVVTSQFTAHGNGDGRQTGERLAVDPNNSKILYCGTRSNGLFKSTDAGLTWSKVSSFPVSTTSNGNGICIVQFDGSSVSGGVTQKIYAGVSQTGSSVYVSTNGGTSWSAVSGQPTTYMPHRMALSGGTLYVTYANAAGPSITSAGGYIYKYSGSTWTNISPSTTTFNYGGISVVGSTILASTVSMWYTQPTWPSGSGTPYGDRIFISTNGGASWTDLMDKSLFAFNNNGIPWITNHALHWAGCAIIDPLNTSRAFVTSGNGLFMTENLTSTAISTWKFMCKGLEETVPLDMVSTASGYPATVIGDYDGAVYPNMVTYPSMHSPEIGSTYGIDCAPDNSLMVRVGGTGSNTPMYYSTNKGVSWTAFATLPNSSYYRGKAAISATGGIVVWSPSNSSTLYKTTNKGSSWTSVSGISLSDAYPVADQVNANKFYVLNGTTIYVSTDGGSTFSAKGTTATGAKKKIRTAPGVEGDLWVACGTGGLYRSTNSGTSFSKLTTIDSCIAVGFGKAATGKTFPTVYAWGTVNKIEGIYRSIDAGATWVRINDDAHEFGGTANGEFVIGDMNTFGTVYMSTAGRGVVYGVESGSSACLQPSLGIDTSLCGLSVPYTLNSNTLTATNVTYKWYKDGIVISAATAPTYSISVAGTYKVERDSSTCAKSDEIIITAALPTLNLGADQDICSATSVTLDAGISKSGYTYQWSKNATTISGATSKTYVATTGGTYSCTVSASNCTAVTDAIVVTNKLLDITPDTVCASGGIASLVVNTTGGPFEWYNVATNGTALATAATYSPTITATTTYYVKDAGGTSYTIGKTAQDDGGTSWNTNTFTDLTTQLNVTVTQAITLQSVSVYVQTAGTNVTIRFLSGTTIAYTYTATNQSAGLQVIPVNFALVPGTYVMDAVGTSNNLYLQSTLGSFPYSLANYISFSNAQSWASAYYGMFYNWKLKVGSTCVRTPVTALVSSSVPCADSQAPTTPGLITFGTVTQNSIVVNWTASTDNIAVTGYEVWVNGVLSTTVTGLTTTLSGLTCNTVYSIQIRAKDAAGNYSAYNAVASTTTLVTVAPTLTTPINYCQNATATALTATGSSLKWYTVAINGTALSAAPTPITTVTGTTTYYVSQTVSSCESQRTSIVVVVNSLPTISLGSDVVLCLGNATTLTASGGASYIWSNSKTTTSITVSPTSSITYTVTGTNSMNCSSTDAVVVTVNAVPQAPTVISPVNYAQNDIATVMTATGVNLLWYTDAATGIGNATAPTPSTLQAATTNYYVSQTINSCESSRSLITVVVKAKQTISLVAGWNLISFYVRPVDSSLATVFGGLGTNLICAKTADAFYNPSQLSYYNSLLKIEIGKAYLVKVTTAQTFTLTGDTIGTVSVSLKKGWNMLGFPKQTQVVINTSVSGITTNINTIKNFDGYWQPSGVNSLTNFTPGLGYFINVKADGLIQW